MSITIRNMTAEELELMVNDEHLDRETFALNEQDLQSLKLYVEHGIPPGDFLQAVICNNLSAALGRADLSNRRRIFEYVQWLYNEAPSICWGSYDAYKNWIAMRSSERSGAV